MSFQRKSRILILMSLVAIACAFIVYKMAYKPHEKIEDQKIEFSGKATDLVRKLQENSDQWQNNIVAIAGVITSKDKDGIMLNNSVYCQLKNLNDLSNLMEGNQVTIKGRVIGYDDLLEELKLDQTIIYNK